MNVLYYASGLLTGVGLVGCFTHSEWAFAIVIGIVMLGVSAAVEYEKCRT